MARHSAEIIPYSFRAWLYRVILASLPIIAAYGYLNDTDTALWAALAAAALTSGPAAAYTHVRPEKQADDLGR